MARWFDRKFDFRARVEDLPTVLERLLSTPQRMKDIGRGLSREVLMRRDGRAWSIMEQFGHLLDLDELHIGRLDDFEARVEVLRPADLENKKTWAANHNEREIEELVEAFAEERYRLTGRLRRYDNSFLERSALHPRLKQPMRVIDLAVFVADHDDHHLAKAEELKRKFLGDVSQPRTAAPPPAVRK
jgi:uncharacterized damage-inducible protein DinB